MRGSVIMSYTIPNFKKDEIREYIQDRIQELKKYSIEEYNQLVKDGELHNELFNTDYYVTYTWEAKEWLSDKVFDVIECITEYEEDNFGEVNTDLTSPEKVVNMYAYILGEEILYNEVLK